MSDEPKNIRAERQGQRAQQAQLKPQGSEAPQAPRASSTAGATPAGPRPEPIRFFGTTWLNHDGNYPARRAGVTVGSLAAVIVSGLVLRLAYEGLQLAAVGGFVSIVVLIMFAICSALAFGHTWGSYTKRPDPARQSSLRGLLTIGFLGSLAAYFLRSLKEAPGEALHRAEYTTAREQYDRRTAKRTGNPAKRHRP
ncbi:EamA/RhaT family transporter [Streptomyces sp. NPDC013978]|uniref:EamA/RhaT family transporter n=1 Tax=Streptomyces sp. NPDC013978 TaxID=3364869 RepID=UPI0036F5D193